MLKGIQIANSYLKDNFAQLLHFLRYFVDLDRATRIVYSYIKSI